MNLFESKLSAIVAWSWIPGMLPLSTPNGVEKTSTSPDEARPTNTILSLKTAGSTSGVWPLCSCSSDASRWRTS